MVLQTGKWAPTSEAINKRARELRRWLKARPEKEIVLVTHGGFLHYFTEDWEDSSVYQGASIRLLHTYSLSLPLSLKRLTSILQEPAGPTPNSAPTSSPTRTTTPRTSRATRLTATTPRSSRRSSRASAAARRGPRRRASSRRSTTNWACRAGTTRACSSAWRRGRPPRCRRGRRSVGRGFKENFVSE